MKMHGWVVTQAALECSVAVLLKHSSAHQTKIAQLEASLRLHVVLNNIAHFIRPLGVWVGGQLQQRHWDSRRDPIVRQKEWLQTDDTLLHISNSTYIKEFCIKPTGGRSTFDTITGIFKGVGFRENYGRTCPLTMF